MWILTRFSLKLNKILATKTESKALNIYNIIEYIKYIIKGFRNSENLLGIKLSIMTIGKIFIFWQDEFCNRLKEMQLCL